MRLETLELIIEAARANESIGDDGDWPDAEHVLRRARERADGRAHEELGQMIDSMHSSSCRPWTQI